MMIMIIEQLWAKKKQHENQTDARLVKCLGLIKRLRPSSLGLNYRDASTARDRPELKTFKLSCRVSLRLGLPGVWNDVWCGDVAGDNVRLSKLEKLGPEDENDYTICT